MSGGESNNDIPADISAEDFGRWLSPRQALEILTTEWSYEVAMDTIVRYLMHGEMLARADKVKLTIHGDTMEFRRTRIPADQWGPGSPPHISHFWENGLFDWADGSSYNKREFSAFDVRFDPVVIRAMLKPSISPGGAVPSPQPTKAAHPVDDEVKRRVGRPAGKDGEPIARLTKRLLALPPEELATYTHEALGAELIEEYKKLRLHPPSADNATRNAGGILRAVRN